MAAQFDTAKVVLQPTQQEAPAQTNVFEQGAQVAAQLGAVAQQDAAQQGNRMSQLYAGAIQTASAGFDRVLAEYNKIAEENGARDAAGIIKRDGNKQLIPPSSFYPPGISSRAYAESFRKNAEATYRQSAEAEYQDYASIKMQEHSGDPAAYAAAMKPKRDAMLTGLDERFAPFLSVRMEQIDGRAESQIAVRLQSETNLVNKQGAEDALASLNSEAARLGKFTQDASRGQTKEGLDKIGQDLLVNNDILRQKWADYETRARTAGVSQAQIDRNKAELGYNAWIHTMVGEFRRANYHDGKGDVDPDAVAAAKDSAYAIAKKFPGREPQVEEKLLGAINVAIGQSQLHAAGVVYRDNKMTAPIIRDLEKRKLAIQALPPDQWEQKQAMTEQLQTEAIQIANNSSISDSAAMKLLGAYQQAGAVSQSALQQSFTGRIASLVDTIGSRQPDVKSEHKAAAFAELQTLDGDTAIARHLTPAQRSAIQGGMDQYVTTNYAAQVGAWDAKILEGGTSPAAIDAGRAYQIQNNMLTAEQIQRAGVVDATAKQKWHEGQTRHTLAKEQAEAHAAGRPWNPDQQAAAEQALAYRPASGGPTTNLADPRDLAQAQEIYQKHGFLPKQVKTALDGMQYSPEQKDVAPYLAMVNTIKQVERKKMEQLVGHTQVDERTEELLEANVASIVGKNHPFLATAKMFGADAAFKKATADATGRGRNLGETPDQFQSALQAELPRLGGTLASLVNNTVVATAEETITLSQEELAAMSPEARAARALKEAQAVPGLIGGIAGIFGIGPGSKVERFEFDGSVGRALMQNATMNAAMNGDAIKTGLVGKPGTIHSHVLATELYSGLRRGEFSITRSADGKVATIGWKTLGDQVAPVLGIEMNESRQRHFAAALVDAHQFRVGGGTTLTTTNADNIAVRSYRSDEGEHRIQISERDRIGIWTRKLDIAKNDPMISVMSLSTIKAATQAVVANAADPKVYGGAVATAVSGPGAPAMLAHVMTGGTVDIKFVTPVAVNFGVLLGSKIQQMQIALNSPEVRGLILGDKKLMNSDQLETLKNVQLNFRTQMADLAAELKKDPNGPGLKEAIAHMRQNFAPHVDDSAFIQMLKDSNFYKPIDLPIPRTGSSRIGTDKP